jgi:transcription elongation factor Elf1
MLETTFINCPYCGEEFEISADCSAGSQQYVEDCAVCCQPIDISIEVDARAQLLAVHARRGDD